MGYAKLHSEYTKLQANKRNKITGKRCKPSTRKQSHKAKYVSRCHKVTEHKLRLQQDL